MVGLILADALLVASPCLSQAVDEDAFVQILRVELGAPSLERARAAKPGAHVIEVVDCVEPGPTIVVRAGRRAASIPLRDVGREARPRVLALASAELATDAWAEPLAAPPPPTPEAPVATVATRAPEPEPERSAWGATGGVVMRVGPGSASGILGGVRFGIDRWYERIGLHAGLSGHFGRSDNRNVSAVLLDVRLSFRGPSFGRLRLDLDGTLETGVAWTDITNDTLAGGGAALVGRFPMAANWEGAISAGYERVYAGEPSDIFALAFEMSRRF